ncbi:siderophore ABC transporter substrate-binding protein [Kytococcus sedentarius]|uniref:siderophore ABC transporter substrate-binding protein n=1 Tax=Kytococcus sedentarius TaxID=1276 RepID=UPI001950DC45|nr:ABC transporter substrate-binding protein [Kytococcus sedentarius]QRO87175.1 ABC transporter substrate-binding protein [Kytococcus sedentarius]
MQRSHLTRGFVLLSVAALSVSACGADESAEAGSGSGSGSGDQAAGTISIEDNHGTQEVTTPPENVVATDNRIFETLDAWGVELKAAPQPLVPEGLDYKTSQDVVDLGLHREPDLEAVVAAEPDLVLNGSRFAQFKGDFEKLVPDATIVELDPRDGEPLDGELKRQTTALGEIFGKTSEAEELNKALDAEIERVKKAYDSEQTVMGLITSGGELGYVAPGNGRTLGPLFDILGLKPALEVEGGSDDHQGDDVSVEAIAESKPDIILVMDRDAAVAADEEGFQPAAEIIEKSEALKDVPAVKNGHVYYMPKDTYVNEGIQTYTEFLKALADGLEGTA